MVCIFLKNNSLQLTGNAKGMYYFWSIGNTDGIKLSLLAVLKVTHVLTNFMLGCSVHDIPTDLN